MLIKRNNPVEFGSLKVGQKFVTDAFSDIPEKQVYIKTYESIMKREDGTASEVDFNAVRLFDGEFDLLDDSDMVLIFDGVLSEI